MEIVNVTNIIHSSAELERLFEVFKSIVDLLDFSKEVRSVNVDSDAAGTDEYVVVLEPSDRLRRISAAFFARDIDALAVEHEAILSEAGDD